jgi:hypothetical protein
MRTCNTSPAQRRCSRRAIEPLERSDDGESAYPRRARIKVKKFSAQETQREEAIVPAYSTSGGSQSVPKQGQKKKNLWDES